MAEIATLEVGDDRFLLVGLGSRFHAVRAAGSERHANYEDWWPRTICGRGWIAPADPEGDPWLGWSPAIAPTCRTCLKVLGRDFEETPEDDRLGVLARAMADAVIAHGSAQCEAVPGDQAERLRRVVKQHVRDRATGSIRSMVHDDIVLVVDNGHPTDQEELRAVMNAIALVPSEPARRERPWLFNWTETR